MNRFGPTPGELRFRLVASLLGLAFLAGALWYRGLPTGPAFVELGLIAGGFFGGTAVHAAWKLIKGTR